MSLSTFRGETGGVAAWDLRPGPRDLLSQDLLAKGTPKAIAVCATSPAVGPAAALAACPAVAARASVRLPGALVFSFPWLPTSGRVELLAFRSAARSTAGWLLSGATVPLLPWTVDAPATIAAASNGAAALALERSLAPASPTRTIDMMRVYVLRLLYTRYAHSVQRTQNGT